MSEYGELKDYLHLQNMCDEFNKDFPVGAKVKVRLDGGEVKSTITTTEAQIIGEHSVVVWLDGIRGCYDISRVDIESPHNAPPNPETV